MKRINPEHIKENNYSRGGNKVDTNKLDYSEHVEIADGIYWVGFADKKAGMHCNPYLIAEDGEAVY